MKQTVKDLLANADVKINGNRPWDIQVKNEKLYSRVLAGGSLALGESYMDNWWNSEAIDEFIYHILSARLDKKVKSVHQIWNFLKAKLINQQKKSRAFIIGKKHYDTGNDLFLNMLDKRMNYSCGYWKDAETLDEAQEAKLDLICKKLKLEKGMKVLDIGCGWGGFAKFAAEKYDTKVVGITVSKEQTKFAKDYCKDYDVEIRLQDYRKINEKFDRIVSVGMIEHVGYKNYKNLMEIANRCLKDDGLFLLQTIADNVSVKSGELWISKYIFPNSMLPSAKQITKAYEGIFKLEDWHNFGKYYDKTLMSWHKNFNKNWDKIKRNYDERFRRMWNYYLLSCAGGFRACYNQLWQIVFSKLGSQISYNRVNL